MKTSKNKDPHSSSQSESEELENLDKDLNELINQNESLKKGITKIIEEIEKNNK